MPSSISTVRWVGLPSSSTLSEPRRGGIVPSSITVTPGAATRSPMRPENAELPLRLKSPSRPWPIASCSRLPGPPAPTPPRLAPVRGEVAVGTGDEDDLVFRGEARHPLDHARIHGACLFLQPLQECDLVGI